MTKTKTPANPFYVALVIVGLAFFITACAYGVMAFRALRLGPAAEEQNPQPLLIFMAKHGETMMATELVLLILFTVAAFSTDSYWSRSKQADDRAIRRARGGNTETISAATQAPPGEATTDANEP